MEKSRTDRNRHQHGAAPRTNNEASGGTFHGPVIMGGQVQFEVQQQAIRNGTRLGAHDQMYSYGEWIDLAYEPVPDAGTGDFADDLRAAGFAHWFAADGFADKAESPYFHDRCIPLNLVVYERDVRVPRFAIELTGNTCGSILTTYAASLPDLMGLLAMWAPTLRLLAEVDGMAKQRRESAEADAVPTPPGPSADLAFLLSKKGRQPGT
ncbi:MULTISPECIES: hypothetical protein [Streptomyces]|uniref:hypothetical protein n=1 Tax=Streptomyces TaxID=1883 RepID=UPI0014163CC9|nr:hypothetical protein [Streptomyces sp. SID7805]MYU53273.1 hypothetical protein [Streptomyces sp. SID7805]